MARRPHALKAMPSPLSDQVIEKGRPLRPAPNLIDYEAAQRSFSWADARLELDAQPGGAGLNIELEAVDRHAMGAARDRVALRFLRKTGNVEELSFGHLCAASARFASGLRALGVEAGAHVFALAGRIPALCISAIGALKARSVLATLFSAFGPEPIAARLKLGRARVLITTESLYRKKVAGIRDELPDLEHVIVVAEGGE